MARDDSLGDQYREILTSLKVMPDEQCERFVAKMLALHALTAGVAEDHAKLRFIAEATLGMNRMQATAFEYAVSIAAECFEPSGELVLFGLLDRARAEVGWPPS